MPDTIIPVADSVNFSLPTVIEAPPCLVDAINGGVKFQRAVYTVHDNVLL